MTEKEATEYIEYLESLEPIYEDENGQVLNIQVVLKKYMKDLKNLKIKNILN